MRLRCTPVETLADPTTIPGVLEAAARSWPDAIGAVGEDGARWSYAALWEQVRAAAAALVAQGIEPGAHVALWADNSPEWIVANGAILASGATVVPCSTRWREVEVADVVERARCALVLRDDEVRSLAHAPAPPASAAAAVDARLRALDPGAASHVQFTSGTTGRPKGARLSHRGMVQTTREWVNIVGLRVGDRYPVVNPMSHIGGHKTGVLAACCAGATVYPIARFDAERLRGLVEREQVTFLQGPPAMFQALLDAIDARGAPVPASVRVAVTGSANIPPALPARMQAVLGLDAVHAGYGLTEATGVCTITRADDPPGLVTRTSGRAIPGVEVRIVGPDGATCPPGTPGEIHVRGVGVMLGYLDDPESTAAAIDADGWLATGDVGFLDDDGNLAICDRLTDMIVVGGFNAYPAEIERVLGEHPSVAQVAVVGVPDDRLGEVPVAFVVPATDAGDPPAREELLAWARERLAPYKTPRAVWYVDVLPLTAVPKVDKAALAARARELTARPAAR